MQEKLKSTIFAAINVIVYEGLRCNHCCAFQGGGGGGGRGNIAQFKAINNDVLFPCEMA